MKTERKKSEILKTSSTGKKKKKKKNIKRIKGKGKTRQMLLPPFYNPSQTHT